MGPKGRLGWGLARTEANSEGPSVSSLGTPTLLTKVTATGLPRLKDTPRKEGEAEEPGEAPGVATQLI